MEPPRWTGKSLSLFRTEPDHDRFQLMRILLLLVALATAGERPQVGDTAPDFKLPGPGGQAVSLAAFKGKTMVVLAFFPKAFTAG
jgi:hypothetical protein